MKLPENYSIGNLESYSSTVKAAQRVLKEYKKKQCKEIDMYRLCVGKTIYCFHTEQKLKNKLRELDTIDYLMAEPGEPLPPKKLKL